MAAVRRGDVVLASLDPTVRGGDQEDPARRGGVQRSHQRTEPARRRGAAHQEHLAPVSQPRRDPRGHGGPELRLEGVDGAGEGRRQAPPRAAPRAPCQLHLLAQIDRALRRHSPCGDPRAPRGRGMRRQWPKRRTWDGLGSAAALLRGLARSRPGSPPPGCRRPSRARASLEQAAECRRPRRRGGGSRQEMLTMRTATVGRGVYQDSSSLRSSCGGAQRGEVPLRPVRGRAEIVELDLRAGRAERPDLRRPCARTRGRRGPAAGRTSRASRPASRGPARP